MEKFDIENFKKNIDDEGYWIYKKENGDAVFAEDAGDEFWEEITPKNSVFTTKNIYYPTGILKMKAVYFHDNGFFKGIWKEYNEQGVLVKETDHDAPYKDFFPWEKVKEYCENREIDLMGRTTVYRSPGAWGIEYFLKDNQEYRGKIYDSETKVNIGLNSKGEVTTEYLTFREESSFTHLAKDELGDGMKGLIIIENPQNKEQSILEIEEISSKQTENIMVAIIIGVTVLMASIILYFKFLKK